MLLDSNCLVCTQQGCRCPHPWAIDLALRIRLCMSDVHCSSILFCSPCLVNQRVYGEETQEEEALTKPFPVAAGRGVLIAKKSLRVDCVSLRVTT